MPSSHTTPDLVLYGYFRSSAAFRVRIALNLKGLAPEQKFVHLLRSGGEQHDDYYKAVNPQELVPTLVHDGEAIGQSLAIIEYLDEIWPEPPLLPREPRACARVRQLACIIACDIHPLNNLRMLLYLRDRLSIGEEARAEWQRHWIGLGFSTLEILLAQSSQTGRFCHGDTPTLADICLIPQMANARRVNLDLSPYPTLIRIEDHALAHPAFEAALPKNQPDAE
ncbi:MAG TPA: maleylacetoacetate isomerase [Rhizomicrobium sp.]|jgi:maleylacetoacetate isomerase|nr:maleylacetoacetate isomerase [Rhizomicrobium sp.]